ncbi:MAG: Cna B-type domain-containing protein, partial [Ruminococcus sp.]|nr:Cna B-type domain-containing protein [Ruminococcus sp.]
VLYKLVEVKSPVVNQEKNSNYVQTPYEEGMAVNDNRMNDFVFYFVYRGKSSDFAGVVDTSKIMQISSGGTIQISNVNQVDISVSKTWAQIPSNTDGVKSTFKLYYSKKRSSTIPTGNDLIEVADSEKEAIFTMENGSLKQSNEIKWTNLPNGKNGEPIYYYVKETSYTINGKTYVLQDDGTYKAGNEVGEYKSLYSGNTLNQSGEVKFTNTKGLYVKKEWKNSDNTSMTNAPVDSIRFKLYGKTTADSNWTEINLTDTERTLSKPDWQINIPSEKLVGYVNFKVEEELLPGQDVTLYGYVVSYIKNLNGNSGILEISNKNPFSTTINFTVKKEWADGLDGHDGIEVTLYRSESSWADYTPTEVEKNAATVIGTPVTLNADNWSYTWEGLENLQKNGTPYYYYAVETVPENYTATYAKSGTSSVQIETITNTPEEVPGKLSVQKKWEKVSDSNKEEITLNLYRRKKALTTNQYDIPNDITVACIGDSITYGEMNNTDTNIKYPKELAALLGVNESKVANNGHNNYLIDGLYK